MDEFPELPLPPGVVIGEPYAQGLRVILPITLIRQIDEAAASADLSRQQLIRAALIEYLEPTPDV